MLTALEHPEEAAEAYRRTVELAPGHVGAHGNLGVILTQLGRLEAIAACQQAIATLVWQAISAWVLHSRQDDHEGTIVAYQETIRRQPDHTRAYKAFKPAPLSTS